MPLRTGCIVLLLQFALGRNQRKWCCGCVSGLGKAWREVGEVARVGESGRESVDGKVRLPCLGEGLIRWVQWQWLSSSNAAGMEYSGDSITSGQPYRTTGFAVNLLRSNCEVLVATHMRRP